MGCPFEVRLDTTNFERNIPQDQGESQALFFYVS